MATQTHAGDAPVFNPFEEGFFDDPYAQYARLREADPVHRTAQGTVICFAYDDVRQLLRNPRTSMSGPGTQKGLFPKGLINLDPPDHTRVRRLMSKVFTPRRIEGLGAWIAMEVRRHLDQLEIEAREQGSVDLVGGLAFPLPFKVISDMLGMPEADQGQIREWAQAITTLTPSVDLSELERAATAFGALSDYVTNEVLPWKRAEPSDDLLSALLSAEEEGDKLSPQELIDQVALLYVAGHETTSGLIGNGIVNLLRNRTQLERLQSDPALLPNAVEELNRFDSAIQLSWRYPLEDLTVRDTVVPEGQLALLCIGSANHDVAHFGPDAERLDIARTDAGDALSFGAGIHFCLGAALARQEAAHAIGQLITRFPDLELAGTPTWNPRITFRALTQLPVDLTA